MNKIMKAFLMQLKELNEVPMDLAASWLHREHFMEELPVNLISDQEELSTLFPVPAHMPESFALINKSIKKGYVKKKLGSNNTEILFITTKGKQKIS